MPTYQIHRLKESQRQQFRWAPHTAGATTVRQKDYELGSVIEAPTVYAAWDQLRRGEHPLEVGDILEVSEGGLRIFKYVGFEDARWFIPESAPQVATVEADAAVASQER